MGTTTLYERVGRHKFSEETCFLCGVGLSRENRSNEHVFPKWLLGEFELWEKKLTLLNDTKISYGRLTVPCCMECNGTHLSSVEREVRESILSGHSAVAAMDRERLMLWTLKVFYGLLYREVLLPFDRSNRQEGPIVTPEEMKIYDLLHLMLQAVRVPMVFSQIESDIPATLYVFRLQTHADKSHRFDYRDNVHLGTISLRLGEVGLLAAFDMGAQSFEGRRYFSRYQNLALHPLQFAELGANLFLKASKFQRTPKVMVYERSSVVEFQVVPIAGLSSAPVFGASEQEELAEMLMWFMGVSRESVISSVGQTYTWLHTDSGTIRHIPLVPTQPT